MQFTWMFQLNKLIPSPFNKATLSKQSIRINSGAENVTSDVLQMTDNEKETTTSQARVPSQRCLIEQYRMGSKLSRPASYDIMDPKSGSAMKHLGITKGER